MTSIAFKESNPKSLAAFSKISSSRVSQLVMMEIAVAMGEGGFKYGGHNYREEGVLYSTYYDATRRHLDYFWEGQDIDALSGLHHVTKAITSLIVLRDAMIMGLAIDNRPPSLSDEELVEFIANLEAVNKQNIERYGHIEPKHVTRFNVDMGRVNACKAEIERLKGENNENENKTGS